MVVAAFVRRPRAGAWIETQSQLHTGGCWGVAPVRGRGLKLHLRTVNSHIGEVAPVRGRGLKLLGGKVRHGKAESPPCGGVD